MSNPQVVRIYATTQEPDYENPWQSSTPSSSTGSGVVIGPREILTGAHVVANSTFLRVQKISEPNKAIATVKAVSHDCDLALLEVGDPHFLSDVMPPAEIGELPELQDRVSVVGFPVGGEEVSITEGVVSRIEVQTYAHSDRDLLAVTVDAAINEGNSGGPVFLEDRVAGIAFQKLSEADNIGEMVPAPLIRNFLAGIAQGKNPEVPGLGITTQNLENPLLRQHLRLRPHESGVLVVCVEYGNSGHGHLQDGDCLLEIDGLRIANNGTVQYRDRYRTRFEVVLGERYIGDEVSLTILRGGERRTVTMRLKPLRHLVRRSQYDVLPSYFIYGGLVFQRLSRDFLAVWDSWWNKAPKEFLHYYYSGVRKETQQEVVILTQILNDEFNIGYEHLYNEAISEINGVKPRDLHDFVRRVEASGDVVKIKTTSNGLIVLDPTDLAEVNRRILQRYHIKLDRSADLIDPGQISPAQSAM